MTSDQPPFRRFELSWIFEPIAGAGCRVSVVATLALRSRLLQRVVDQVLPAAVDGIITAFEARARAGGSTAACQAVAAKQRRLVGDEGFEPPTPSV